MRRVRLGLPGTGVPRGRRPPSVPRRRGWGHRAEAGTRGSPGLPGGGGPSGLNGEDVSPRLERGTRVTSRPAGPRGGACRVQGGCLGWPFGRGPRLPLAPACPGEHAARAVFRGWSEGRGLRRQGFRGPEDRLPFLLQVRNCRRSPAFRQQRVGVSQRDAGSYAGGPHVGKWVPKHLRSRALLGDGASVTRGAARTEGSARFKPAPSAGYRGVVAGPGRRQSALAVGRCAGVPAVRSGPQGPSGASEFWFADSSVRAKDNVLRHVHRKRSAVRRFRGGFACSTEMSSHLFSVLPASSF